MSKSLCFRWMSSLTIATLGSLFGTSVWLPETRADEPQKITFDDHIKPIFREHCTSCHNNNAKKSGLSLETYQATMDGGSGGGIVSAGDIDSSRLYALTAHKEQPIMPPMQDRIPQPKLDLLKTWIEQGMPENSGSAIRKPTANAAALSVSATGRPEGAPPMPTSMFKQTPLFTPRASAISALAASPWSPLVAVGGQMQVSLYHSGTGQLLGIIPFPEGEPQSITFSRDGKLILIGGGRHSSSGFAVLHDIATGKRLAKVGDELDIVMAADISDDNRLIALAGPQKMVRVYDTLTGQLRWEQKKHTDWIYGVRFSPDGLLLATSDRSAGLVVWEGQTGRLYLDLQGHKSEIRSIAWRPDSQALVSASMDGTLKMWDMNEGKIIKSWDAHGGGATSVAICNNGTIVSTGRDNKVKVWDGAGNGAGEMPPLAEAGLEVAITVDATHVAAGDWAGNVRLWTRANPAEERRLAANPPTLELALSNADQRLQQANGALQAVQGEYKNQETVTIAAQKQLTDHQALIADYVAKIAAANESINSLKPVVDQLAAAVPMKEAELTTQRNALTEKNTQLTTISQQKKELDDSVAALQKQKEVPDANAADLDAKIAEAAKQIEARVATITALQAEAQTIQSDITGREKGIVELKANLETKSKEMGTLATKVQEFTAAKGTADQQLEAITNAAKAANDALAASKVKLDNAGATVAATQAEIAMLQQDIQRFAAAAGEFAAKRTGIEAQIAQANAESQPVEAAITTTKSQLNQTLEEIKKLEQQIAALQAMVTTVQGTKTGIEQTMNTHRQALETIKNKVLQSETDLADLVLQQQLFEQAYGKK